MDLDAPMILTTKDGKSIKLPTINLLRITMVKIQPLMLEFQQETGKSDLVSFNKWMSDKLGMTGKNVML